MEPLSLSRTVFNPGDPIAGSFELLAKNAIEVHWIDDENLEVSYRQNESPAYKENNAVKVESKYGIEIHHLIKK